MASQTFDFFGLPRELRDMVYAKLTVVHEFTWLWDATEDDAEEDTDDDAEDDENNGRDATLFVVNAPDLEILLVNSQMRDKYLQSACLKDLTVKMYTNLRPGTGGFYGPQPATDETQVLVILARARHATLAIDFVYDACSTAGGGSETWWNDAQEFFGLFTAATSNLSVLQLAIQHRDRDDSDEDTLSHCKYLDGRKPEYIAEKRALLSPPPVSFAGLPLVQRGEGYRLSYCFNYPIATALLDPELIPDILPGRTVVAYHEVVRVGVYVYGRDKSAGGYWEADEVLNTLDPTHSLGHDYLELFDPQTKEERVMLRRLPYEMNHWKEKRGDEVMEWNG
jgi:hypothetical protein